jgi:hypothetical protein
VVKRHQEKRTVGKIEITKADRGKRATQQLSQTSKTLFFDWKKKMTLLVCIPLEAEQRRR